MGVQLVTRARQACTLTIATILQNDTVQEEPGFERIAQDPYIDASVVHDP